MRYLEETELCPEIWYECETYEGRSVVLKYLGNGKFDNGNFEHDVDFSTVRYVFRPLLSRDLVKWISVKDKMPEQRIRVWASTGPTDIGHDCFYGKAGIMFSAMRECKTEKEQDEYWSMQWTDCWRKTETEEPVKRPILFWMPLWMNEPIEVNNEPS